MVGTGERMLRQWRGLPVPRAIDGEITTVLDRYDKGLAAYGAAARWLAAGQTEEGDNLLRRGDRLGRDFQGLATEAGFEECNEALPL